MKHKPPTYFLDGDVGVRLQEFSDEFLELSALHFGHDTANIREYVRNCEKSGTDDNFAWATFDRDFYYVELATIGVLNRCMWNGFCRADNIVLFIPDCLSLLGDKCKRKGDAFLECCDQCVPNCEVNQIVQFKDRYNFREVFAYRDQTEQFRLLRDKYESVAFLGIACILMLASGLRTSMASRIPAHGVPLRYSACEHWAKPAFPTATDLKTIEAVLRAREAERDGNK
jgi:hypothetical protein